MSAAYYNEHDAYAAAWLRNLIDAGHIAAGVVDERSIEDVHPRDLDGFTQCHFFAGIGVWSYALRRAGWADDRPVWTGSCPCQPFSAAGKGAGFDDERHLWPAWHHLISECRPGVVFGEQVASSDGLGWLDLVHADLEATGYAVGAVDLCAAGVGAPHIRQRLWFVGHAEMQRHQRRAFGGRPARRRLEQSSELGNAGDARLAQRLGLGRVPGGPAGADEGQAAERAGIHAGELADPDGRHAGAEGLQRSRKHGQQPQDGGAVWLGDAASRIGSNQRVGDGSVGQHVGAESRPAGRSGGGSGAEGSSVVLAGNAATAGFWSDADWLPCRDGKARPVEPGTFPLAHGAPARVGRLRAYGNAINAEAAAAFVMAAA